MKRWLGEFGCWLSQGINLFICVTGATADETTSSRVGKYKRANRGRVPFSSAWPLPFLWFTYHTLSRTPWLKGHFINAIEDDEGQRK